MARGKDHHPRKAGSGSHVKKGTRPGGRRGNTPNKRTTEAIERARLDVENARGAGKKLGKEVLEEFMHLFAGMAAQYQPLPANVVIPGREPNEDKFLTYAKLAVQTAKDLADFQSPKFRAIMVSAPTDQPGKTINPDGSNVTQLPSDAAALARVYTNMVRRVG